MIYILVCETLENRILFRKSDPHKLIYSVGPRYNPVCIFSQRITLDFMIAYVLALNKRGCYSGKIFIFFYRQKSKMAPWQPSLIFTFFK